MHGVGVGVGIGVGLEFISGGCAFGIGIGICICVEATAPIFSFTCTVVGVVTGIACAGPWIGWICDDGGGGCNGDFITGLVDCTYREGLGCGTFVTYCGVGNVPRLING